MILDQLNVLPHRLKSWLFTSALSAWVMALALTLAACDDDEPAVCEGACAEEATAELLSCVVAWRDMSYWRRVPRAQTFFLPLIKGEEMCQGVEWRLLEAPPRSQRELQRHDRFTQLTTDEIGVYRFGLQRGDFTAEYPERLEVIEALERPFHNYNYFPSDRAQVHVDGQLWVAGVYTPQIGRLDLESGEALEPILVGAWPTALAYAPQEGLAFVAHKAEDTLGIIDVAQGKLIDAIWVGDEPTNLVWDATRRRVYVALGSAHAVAIVDVEARQVVKHIDAVFDPLAMALDEAQGRLYVASHRSGQSELYPYEQRELSTERDIAVIDVEALEVSRFMLEVASTIHAMRWYESSDSPDGSLWITATTSRPQGSLNDAESMSFSHELIELDLDSAVEAATGSVSRVDLTRQASSSGPTATLQGFARCGDSWWVLAEGSNQAVELALDGSELQRVEITGKARSVSCDDSGVWVWSPNRLTVTRIDAGQAPQSYEMNLTDPREESLKFGLELFSNQGDDSGANRSCNQCHVDGLSDNLVWNAGPVRSRKLSRPFRWLEGTGYIGWDGYVGSVKISGYVGGATINHRGNTEESLALGAYLASIMPAPAANQWTERDGSLSELALVGESLFQGEAACVACHSGPQLTNQQILDEGFTEGRTDIPSLVDVNRLESWYKTGGMSTLRQAVAESANQTNITLDEAQLDALTQYMRELTGRSFFVLNADLAPQQQRVAIDPIFRLNFSYPLLEGSDNLANVRLLDDQDQEIPCIVAADLRLLRVKPRVLLEPSASYRLVIGEALSSDQGQTLAEPYELEFTTAAPPSLRLEGVYDLTVTVPRLNFSEGAFDDEQRVSQTSKLTATPTEHGANIELFYGGDMLYQDQVVIEGDRLYSRDLPIAVGPAFLNAVPLEVTLIDADADGVADSFNTNVTLTGPGIYLEDTPLVLEKTSDEFVCTPGSEGDHAPVVSTEGDRLTIDWGAAGTLGLFITTPDADLPVGPGTVSGGETFWVVTATEYPTTFNGPVVYGEVPDLATDTSEENGGVLGGVPLESGQCVRFSVVVDFQYSHTIIEWP